MHKQLANPQSSHTILSHPLPCTHTETQRHAHTHMHTFPCMHTLTLSFACLLIHTPTFPGTLTLKHIPTLSHRYLLSLLHELFPLGVCTLTISCTHPHTVTHTDAHAHTHTKSHAHTHAHAENLTPAHRILCAQTRTQSLSGTVSHTDSLSLSLSLTHTHTHTHTHTELNGNSFRSPPSLRTPCFPSGTVPPSSACPGSHVMPGPARVLFTPCAPLAEDGVKACKDVAGWATAFSQPEAPAPSALLHSQGHSAPQSLSPLPLRGTSHGMLPLVLNYLPQPEFSSDTRISFHRPEEELCVAQKLVSSTNRS
ncbi:uncharacterized protein LOC123352170 [Mauremys mutica]|uniref:uncharacterized protein LOC123352170 n=1 Tax=Mauremys mutica TaxID=74926 RepID=UPI001D164075|nr:uncharacterized protein LOC123352170 [Mauremys mutica]